MEKVVTSNRYLRTYGLNSGLLQISLVVVLLQEWDGDEGVMW
jgi:hypothetical protein